MDDKKIAALLEKTGNPPFYFGGYDVAHFWRVAKIDDVIYAQKVIYADNKKCESFSFCSVSDNSSKQEIFDNVVLDFVTFYANVWQSGRGQIERIFTDEVAGIGDLGLQEILEALDQSYSAFLNHVMYRYGTIARVKPDCDGKKQIRSDSRLSETERIAKNVVDKLSTNEPLVITQGNSTFEWNLVKAHGKIWFSRRTSRDHGSYILYSEEYGRVSKSDSDSFSALRDAIAGCFMLDGWEIQNDNNPEDLLCLVDLSLETI